MKKISWIWIVIIALLAIASPSVIDRWQAEQHSDQYEIMLPFEEIERAATESKYSINEILQEYKSKGLQNVSLEPITLESLKLKGVITIDSESEFIAALRFSQYEDDIDRKKVGFYISVPEDASYQQLIEETVKPEMIQLGDRKFYFLSSKSKYSIRSSLGYDPVSIEVITKNGLDYTFRVPNDKNSELNELLVQQLIDLKTDHVDGLLPLGSEIIGAGHPNRNELIQQLYYAGYYFYTIEEAAIKEANAVGKITDYNVIRLHSMNPNDSYTEGLGINGQSERAVRAIKERNIRSLYYHIKLTGDMDENVENVSKFLDQVAEKMPAHFSVGEPKLFEKVSTPAWALALIFLAGALFMYKAAEVLRMKKLQILAGALMLVIAAAYVLLDRILFLQMFALIIAITAPTYAVIKNSNGTAKISSILMQYLKAAGIVVVGIAIVISLVNGNMFFVKYEVFRGVLFVYALPLAATAFLAFIRIFNIDFSEPKSAIKKIFSLLNLNIKYWHIVVIMLIAAVGYFYMGRTGNNGISFAFELQFRDWLENTLYVRPRTKEFLIGFPLFVLALYVLKTNKVLGNILLIGGAIGFLSIMNTFNHLHIPLMLSVVRTVYGLILGFIFGLLFIAIYKLIMRFIVSPIKKGWN